MTECHSRMHPETCEWDTDPYSNQLKPKLLLLEPVPEVCLLNCCNVSLQNLYHKNMQMQIIHYIPSCGRGSVTCGNPLTFVEDSDTEDEL